MHPNLLPKVLFFLLATLQLAACGGGGGGDVSSTPPVTQYSISASSEPATGGVVRGSGSYRSGALYTLTAVPEPGFVFVRWEEGGSEITAARSAELIGTASANRAVTAVFLEAGLSLAPQTLELQAGETAQLTATLTMDGVEIGDVSDQVAWTANDPAVTSVDDNGRVTAEAEGLTDIVAAFGGRVASASVRVLPEMIESLRFAPDSVTLVTGEVYTPVLVADYSSGSSRTLALNQISDWASSSVEVPVSDAGVIEALGPVGPPPATITANLDGQQASLNVTVENADLSNIEITVPGQLLQLTVGDQIQFSAMGHYNNSESRDITDRVTWEVSGDPALTVSSSYPDYGLANAVAAGTANVEATLDGETSGIVSVTVAADPLAPASVTLGVTGDDAVRWNATSPPTLILNSLIRDGTDSALTGAANVIYTVVRGPLVFEGGALSVTRAAAQGSSSLSATATGQGFATISARVEGTSLVASTRVYIVNEFSEVIVPSRISRMVTVDGEERLRLRFGLLNLSNVAIPVAELGIRVPGLPEVVLTSPDGSGPNYLPFSAVPGRSEVGQGILFDSGTTGIEATYLLRAPDDVPEDYEIDL